jgi:hypothetical protein
MGYSINDSGIGQAYLAEGISFTWEFGGFTVGNFHAFDVQCTYPTGGNWVSQGITAPSIGLQSPPTSTNQGAPNIPGLSYLLTVQNFAADGDFQIMVLHVS